MIWNYVLAIVVFGFIIFIHELGHFVAAKLSGITVYQFTIGFGPAIFKKTVGGTIYALRLLPIGGAVMMKDISEEPPEGVAPEDWTEEGSFQQASWPARFAVIIAGSLMNFVCGVVIIFMIFSFFVPHEVISQPVLSGVAEGFTPENLFQPGDEFVNVNGFHIFVCDDIVTALYLGSGEKYDIVIRRDGEKITLKDVSIEPKVYEEGEAARYGLNFTTEEANVLNMAGFSFNNAFSFFQSAYKSLGMLVTGRAHTSDLIGTVGIANEISQRAERSMVDMWYFVAFLAVNLSFVNMLPIPGLDGGKVLLMLVELIRRKPLDPKVENYISYAGLGLVMLLFVFVTYNDIVRLITG